MESRRERQSKGMLTYPSDPLPQIVFPMDEDAIPPNTFCSAPPQREPSPPPPLLSLSSITPSCSNNGTSSHRRSGRIKAQTPKKQSITDSEAAQRPARQNRSPSKRQRDAGSMVQVPYSEQPRVERPHGAEKQNKEEFNFSAEQQNMQSDQRSSQIKPTVSPTESVEEHFADQAQNFAMEPCEGLDVGHDYENPSVPKGWMIGPLFQSLKTKMASFTEIVMSPVKLFRASSPPPSVDHPEDFNECEPEAAGTSDMELSKPFDMFHPVAQGDTSSQDTVVTDVTQNTNPVKYSKMLSFDVEMSTISECGDECSATRTERNSDSVPFQHVPSPLSVSERSSDLLRPSECVSASSHESELKIITSAEEKKGILTVQLKPQPRKYPGSRRRAISKTLVSDVKKEPELNTLVKLNKAESHNGASSSLSSSDCFPHTKDSPHLDVDELIRPNSQNNLNDRADARTVKTQQLEIQLNPAASSPAGFGGTGKKRKENCSQDSVRKKRLHADQRLKEEFSSLASNVAASTRKKAVWTNCGVEREAELKPERKGPAVLTRANKKEKDVQEIFASGDVLNAQNESSTDLISVCSLSKDSGVEETTQMSSSMEVKSSGSRRRLKTKTDLERSEEAVDNGMDLETTVNITQSKQEALPDHLVRPDIKQLQSRSRCRDVTKKPLKRKSPKQAASTSKSDISVSTSSAVQLSVELVPIDSDASQQDENMKGELNQPTKRPRKGIRGVNKSSTSAGSEETKTCIPHMPTKGKQSREGKQKVSVDPVYFEMTPSESPPQPEPPLPQPLLDCYVELSNIDEGVKENEKMSDSVADEVFSTNVEASVTNNTTENTTDNTSDPLLRPAVRGVTRRPRRVDKQRRRCRVMHHRTRAEVTNSITMDDADLTARSSQGGSSKSLLRSYSCPEIHSLSHHDTPWTPSLHSPQLSRIHTSHQHSASHSPFVHHVHKSPRRARRHTVCSLEVEREIAPLCLRKEVYPSRRSVPYDSSAPHLSPVIALSPTTSLKALATCFLSSPLAFLSKKVESRGAASSPSTSSPVFSPSSSSSSSIHPLSPSTWRLPGFLQRTDSSRVPLDSSSSGNPLGCEIERRGQSEEEDDGGDTSSSSQEFEDLALRDDKSLSDSEIKVVKKLEERGKVSSIRIRKTLPKPQNNLTPMGLPKPVRLKKKEFSLEEIYTNKNYSKPPESRLETIFEVPLNRKNGSESWFGQRRLKRFLEFLEVGEARKPKKPLVGAGKAGNSRTRRGGCNDKPSLSPQDVHSLLCAKLDQLNLCLMHDQIDS